MDEALPEYEPRTVHMVIRARWDLNTGNPKEKTLFEKPGTIDLSRPLDFKDRAIGIVENTRIFVRFTSRVTKESRDIIEGQFLDYLKMSFTVWADAVGSADLHFSENENLLADASFEAESANLIDPNSRYATSSLVVGPVRNKYYIDFSLLFRI